MQFLADFFPLILFFVAFKLAGIYVATAAAIAASFLQIAYFRWVRGWVNSSGFIGIKPKSAILICSCSLAATRSWSRTHLRAFCPFA